MPVVLVAGVILAVTWRAAQEAAYAQASHELERIQSTVADKVNGLLAVPERAVSFNQALLDEGKLDWADPAGWRETLVAESSAFPMLSAITWGGEDGTSTWLARYGRGDVKRFYAILTPADRGVMREYAVSDDGVDDAASSTFSFDPRGRPWYRAAVEAGGPTWSEPYVWAGDAAADSVTMGLSFSQPYETKDGRRIGVLSADLNLDDISTFLAALKIGLTGSCFIMEDDGRLIASSTNAPLFDDQQRRWSAAHSPDPTIAALGKHWSGIRPVGSGPGRSRIPLSGGDAFTMHSPIGRDAGLNWTVVTIVPEADFLGAAWRSQRRALMICLAVLAMTVVCGVLVARWLARPVVALENHARRIGAGDFKSTIDLRQTSEFQRLSNAMNAMSVDLHKHMELRRSLATAMEVQQSLLPQGLPAIRGLDIAGKSKYCDQTGGDYYDFLELSGLSECTVAMVIGDVVGHGIAAAMLMATARGILRSRCSDPGTTGELMTHLNDLLVDVTRGRRFMTMLMATVDTESRELRWASAGHYLPFIYDPNKRQFLELDGGGLPLGVMGNQTYKEYVVGSLPPRAVLVLVTDGVFEAHSEHGEMYGKERIMHLIAEHSEDSAHDLAARLDHDLMAFQGASSQEDDITFVIAKLSDPAIDH